MRVIANAFDGMDHGTMEFVPDSLNTPEELAWIEQIARTTGCTITPLVTAGLGPVWDLAEKLDADGFKLRPQVGARPASILMMLDGTINPMRQFPAYREIHDLPLAERQRRLLDPLFRQRVLTEETLPPRGVHPREVMMDTLAAGNPLLILFGRYEGDLEGQREVIEHPLSVFGLSDGGAHCGVLVDASVPTYMLSYFTRDRIRGPRMSLEFVVHKLSQDAAGLYGLNDRGVIAPGYKADFNLIDYDTLKLHKPKMVYDLPAGGKRLVQKADGYRATICAGAVTYENGEHTGALPGRLLLGAPAAATAG